MEDMKEAATIEQAHAFVESFPEGYETYLGQGGVNLLGEQKQRVAIARTLIRKLEILILDDCTSAVGLNTEAKSKEGLREYRQGLTVFIITQRITSVMHADRIIVLDHEEQVGIENGRIAENGSHKELMMKKESYYRLYKRY